MINPKEYCEYILGKEKAAEFALWAFGPNFSSTLFNKFPEKWNILHGEKLEIFANGKPEDDLPKMIQIWKTSNENSSK